MLTRIAGLVLFFLVLVAPMAEADKSCAAEGVTSGNCAQWCKEQDPQSLYTGSSFSFGSSSSSGERSCCLCNNSDVFCSDNDESCQAKGITEPSKREAPTTGGDCSKYGVTDLDSCSVACGTLSGPENSWTDPSLGADAAECGCNGKVYLCSGAESTTKTLGGSIMMAGMAVLAFL